jgi:phage baseplate assembly protein W
VKRRDDVAFPLAFDGRGRTALADLDRHVSDMIEQVLFTAPGERVMRPTFGSGLLQLPFQPNGETLATTTEFLVRGSLQQWLGDVIDITAVTVVRDDAALRISVSYVVRRDGRNGTAVFEQAT